MSRASSAFAASALRPWASRIVPKVRYPASARPSKISFPKPELDPVTTAIFFDMAV